MDGDIFKPISKEDGFKNGRIKRYPNGDYEVLVCSDSCFNPQKLEKIKNNNYRGGKKENEASSSESLERSSRRARAAVRDILRANYLPLFVTLTLDKEKIERYDYKAIYKKLRCWLDNKVRRNGLKYVLVPEHHKDGAVHFHGLVNDVLEKTDSGKKTERGQAIYNLPQWKFGFTTAMEIVGEYAAAVNYVVKYISKSSDKIGGRWYLSGGNLDKPKFEYFDCEFSETLTDTQEYIPQGAKMAFKGRFYKFCENTQSTI